MLIGHRTCNAEDVGLASICRKFSFRTLSSLFSLFLYILIKHNNQVPLQFLWLPCVLLRIVLTNEIISASECLIFLVLMYRACRHSALPLTLVGKFQISRARLSYLFVSFLMHKLTILSASAFILRNIIWCLTNNYKIKKNQQGLTSCVCSLMDIYFEKQKVSKFTRKKYLRILIVYNNQEKRYLTLFAISAGTISYKILLLHSRWGTSR